MIMDEDDVSVAEVVKFKCGLSTRMALSLYRGGRPISRKRRT